MTAMAMEMSLKKWSGAASNFITHIPSRSIIDQMLAIFSGVEFLKTVSKFRKRKRKSFCCVHVFHKTGKYEAFSHRSCAVKAKKYTEKA